jgi:nijmegen breakage syndrome protein 1
MELDPPHSHEPETQTAGVKRKSPPMNYELSDDEEDAIEQIAPAATALKRRRLAEDAARRRRGESTPPPPEAKPAVTVKSFPPKKKTRKEIDILEAARLQREKAEEEAIAEHEKRREQLDDEDIEAIRDLAIVEDMEVRRSAPPSRPSRADESDRWDDKWNGRKNFKKFRRAGGENGRRAIDRVIVPLEEAKKKDYGIGDDYWLEGDSHSKKKKGRGRNRDTQDVSQSQSQPSRQKNHAPTRAAEILAKEEMMDDEVLPDSPHLVSESEPDEPPRPPVSKVSSRSQKSQKLADKTNASQNVSPRKKRVASTTLTKPEHAKKVKPAPIAVNESDDSDDEFKFKFRKKA